MSSYCGYLHVLNMTGGASVKSLLAIENPDDEKYLKPPPGIMWSRSQCPKCGHLIKSYENVPLLSYLFLRGSLLFV